MKNHSKAAALLAVMSVMGSASSVRQQIVRDNKLRKGAPKPTDEDRNAMKGLKAFYYGGSVVWAINQKNADRKAKKLNLI